MTATTRTRKAAPKTATAPAAPAAPPKPAAKKAPARKAAAKPASAPLASALAAGEIKLFRVRKNGTTRRIPFLVAGSTERGTAEQIAAQRDAGKTLREICEALHLSPATVRRALTNLVLAQAVETGATEAQLTEQGYRVAHSAEKSA